MARTGDNPVVTRMRVIPVAGHGSLLPDLRGAHPPLWIRDPVLPQGGPGAPDRGSAADPRGPAPALQARHRPGARPCDGHALPCPDFEHDPEQPRHEH